jgi:hypothetical protein
MEKIARDRLKAANRRSLHGAEVEDMSTTLMIIVACTCLWWTTEQLMKGYFASFGGKELKI